MATGVQMRSMYDAEGARNNIYAGALDALSKRFPVEDDDYKLELINPHYSGPQDFTLTQQKKALMHNRRLTTPITGTWRLTHKPTNKVLDERKDVVMSIPYYTNRGTFINNGNDYSIVTQGRLLPGAYIRRQRTGEVEAQFNVEPGSGRGMRLHLQPDTGEFKVGIGSAHIPLYSLLNAMGVEDKELMKMWGADLLDANMRKHNAQNLGKLYQRLAGYKADAAADENTMRNYLRDELPKYKLDPAVVARTLGIENADGISKEVLLRATQKMLNVSRGEEGTDDRDSTQFARVYGVEDLVRERIDKDAGQLTRNLLWRIRRSRNLKPVQYGALNPYVDSLILGSGLAMPLEETNPLSTLEQMTRITKLGEGGIGSAEAITDEARDVNASQFGFIDPIAGPEGLNIGIDVRTAHGVMKGADNKLYQQVVDARSGKTKYISPDIAVNSVLAYPGQDLTQREVYAMKDGKVQAVPSKEVDYQLPSFSNMFSANTNLNPMPTAVQPGRQFYGLKFWSQYLPQKKGEVPLVDAVMDDGKTTFSELYGRKVGTLQAKTDGTVTKVTDDFVTVTDAEGKKHTYDTVKNFPFNRISSISYTATVKPGDTVKAGDMVAHSSFTDAKTGALNLGQNLRVAVIPYRGASFEDAVVISESAAKRLSTERLYGIDADTRNGVEINKNRYISAFPDNFTKEQVETLDSKGVVKVGTILKRGDPIVAAVGPKLLSSADAQLGRLHKVLRNSFTDKAQVWEYDYPGEVVDVAHLRSGAKVNIKAVQPVAVGDKLSTRFGLKGVVGAIVPDDEMPRNHATNETYEMLMNPMGILSRVAPNQIMEMSLGKLARQRGEQVRIPQLRPQEGWAKWSSAQLEAAGVPDASDVFDPSTGKVIKNIGDGSVYVAAFHHLADKKLSSRGEAGTYTADHQPAKGGPTGSKRFSSMNVTAALAHGSTAVIKDAITIRGTQNEEFWKALRLGRPLPDPEVPFIYDKFLNTLRAGGINVVEQGDITSIMPMTDADITKLSRGSVDSSSMLDDDLNPIAGGLFDAGRTGGTAGNKWTHITLPEPVPNPVMEEPVRRVLGLTVKRLENILAGEEELDGKTGGAAIRSALSKLDPDAMINEYRDKVKTLRGSNRDNAVKVLGYLDGARKQGVHPKDWMISKVPVLPPMFRPISKLGDVALVADINELYRDLIENAEAYKELKGTLPDDALTSERLNIYKSVQAAFGLGDPITPEGQSKRIKGAIRQVIGTRPKTGLFQSKVTSKTVDVVGRGVATPNPNLSMDQIGIPEKSAWEMYKDFVTRGLVRRGYDAPTALELIAQRHPTARAMLEDEMKKRPVLVDRAPTWHKFNFLAFYPHMVEGDTLQVSPLIVKGFNLDFDGDQMNFHVPVSDKAVEQAKGKMLPSKNLFSLTDLKSARHTPSMEMTMGLYWLTRKANKRKKVRRFGSTSEAEKAYRKGEIGANDPIQIG